MSTSAECGTKNNPFQKGLAGDKTILASVHTAWLCGTCKVDRSRAPPGCALVQAANACSPAEVMTLTNESDKAMAAGPVMPSALDLSKEWLCDTGAAYDLVSQDMADPHTDYQAPAKNTLTFIQQMEFIAPKPPCP